jgi:hypothetical protein
MDAKLANSTILADGFPHWDFTVRMVGGEYIVPIIYDGEEEGQQAATTAFTNTGSVEQLPVFGAPWLDAMVRGTPFATVDSTIAQQLSAGGYGNYRPVYDIRNDSQLFVTIKKRSATS